MFQDFWDSELARPEVVVSVDVDVDFLRRVPVVLVRAFGFGVNILLKIDLNYLNG